MPLFLANHNRIANNLMQYDQSIVPEHLSGGGGFSITKYSLDGLFEQHELLHNWWTTSNDQLPLIRYHGCKFKLYASDDVDYVFAYQNTTPMLATEQMYLSTQPSMLMLNKNKILMPSKRTKQRYRPYRKIFITPPTQLQNRWYFQQDLATQPLLLTLCSAASFDHYYISTDAESTNISFTTLNPTVFHFHNFQRPPSTGYHPKDKYYFWATKNGGDSPKWSELIYLGETPIRQPGITIGETTNSGTNKAQTYFSSWKNWGNIFYHTYINGDQTVWVSQKSPTELLQAGGTWTADTNLNNPAHDITKLSQPLLIRCRYNPMRDKGYNSSIYLVSNLTDTQTGWEKPTDPNLITEGYPLWLLPWGWLDWQKKLSRVQQIGTNYTVVLTSNAVSPQLNYYIPVDKYFLNNSSPYRQQGNITDEDQRKWYPKADFQTETLTNLCKSGPGTPKLGTKKTVEAKCQYTFYFKVGGNPAQMEHIKNPADQGKWPIPTTNNIFQTPSLQSPTQPIEYFLYNFDQKRHELTTTAIQRITKNWELTKALLTDGTTSKCDTDPQQALQTLQDLQNQETETEEKETSLFEQLRQQQQLQRQLKLRILSLMQQNLE